MRNLIGAAAFTLLSLPVLAFELSQDTLSAFEQARDFQQSRHYQMSSIESIDGDVTSTVFEYSPKTGVSLIAKNDEPAAKLDRDDIKDFKEEFNEARKQGKDGFYPKMSTIKFVEENENQAIFEVKIDYYVKGDFEKKDSKAFVGELIFDKALQQISEFKVRNIKDFSPQFMVKVKELLTVESYQLNNGKLELTSMHTDFLAKAAGIGIEGEFSSTISYLD